MSSNPIIMGNFPSPSKDAMFLRIVLTIDVMQIVSQWLSCSGNSDTSTQAKTGKKPALSC